MSESRLRSEESTISPVSEPWIALASDSVVVRALDRGDPVAGVAGDPVGLDAVARGAEQQHARHRVAGERLRRTTLRREAVTASPVRLPVAEHALEAVAVGAVEHVDPAPRDRAHGDPGHAVAVGGVEADAGRELLDRAAA